MMRPRPARWFEVLCARQDALVLLEALGSTGMVELEAPADVAMPIEWSDLAPGLAEFHSWQARFGSYWPSAITPDRSCPRSPPLILHSALLAIRSWAQECEPHISNLQRNADERRTLATWIAAIRAWIALPATMPDYLQHGGALIGTWLIDPGSSGVDLSTIGLVRELQLDDGRRVAIVVADRQAIVRVEAQVQAGHGQVLPAPEWLPQRLNDVEQAAADRLAMLVERDRDARQHLQAATERHGLAQALAELERLDWIARSVRGLHTTRLLAVVSGWTCDASGARIESAVGSCGARALLHFPSAPARLSPPLLLSNPRWARPFEIFSRAFGVPGADEADPTAVVAVIAPLLFGYMFGDVGQGAVIALAGAWLQRQSPYGRLLLSAGLASMAFGWVYGSVFALEDLIAPLWLHPLEQPLQVLALPLVAGAALLLVGLGLNALGAWWRGRFDEWLRRDAGGVLVYAGLLGAALDRRALWLSGVGALATLLASALHERRVVALFGALGELLERTLQLLVNTLSFARVGAFALAHAGLSSAVVALAGAAGHGWAAGLTLLLGNLVILVMEAMVVSIQTTRLVLFEFFTRFLTGAGRVFVPLPPPPSLSGEFR